MEKRIHTETLAGGLSFDMIYVEGGRYLMGSEEEVARGNEKPVHEVNLSSFYIGKYPVIQELWEAVMGNNPSKFLGPQHPVQYVPWVEVQKFLKKLNQESGKSYRLPYEAEWEFAARGGIHSKGYLFSGGNTMEEVGWYEDNNDPNGTKPVGQKRANELGIYDMSGNVYEWCDDDGHGDYVGAPTDGTSWIDVPTRSLHRMIRGGCYMLSQISSRIPARARNKAIYGDNYVGFRLALTELS